MAVSIHAPREGERHRPQTSIPSRPGFNPRSPRGGATNCEWRERRLTCVSIHAPREGERHARGAALSRGRQVSIHAPREGERPEISRAGNPGTGFQSTLPARGSDICAAVVGHHQRSFNPRSPRGGATHHRALADRLRNVSIHAPREGERRGSTRRNACHSAFQSTLPARGSDLACYPSGLVYFGFQSTLPARGSDSPAHRAAHPSRASFNPRSPRGGATGRPPAPGHRGTVSIHAPREGERRGISLCLLTVWAFQSTLPARGSDTNIWRCKSASCHIWARALCLPGFSGRFEAYMRFLRCRFPAKAPRFLCSLRVRNQAMSGPSRSNVGLAPKCSTRRRQWLPR